MDNENLPQLVIAEVRGLSDGNVLRFRIDLKRFRDGIKTDLECLVEGLCQKRPGMVKFFKHPHPTSIFISKPHHCYERDVIKCKKN